MLLRLCEFEGFLVYIENGKQVFMASLPGIERID